MAEKQTQLDWNSLCLKTYKCVFLRKERAKILLLWCEKLISNDKKLWAAVIALKVVRPIIMFKGIRELLFHMDDLSVWLLCSLDKWKNKSCGLCLVMLH